MSFADYLKNRKYLKERRKQLKQAMLDNPDAIYLINGRSANSEDCKTKEEYCLYPLVDNYAFFEIAQNVMAELLKHCMTINSVRSCVKIEDKSGKQQIFNPNPTNFMKTYYAFSKNNNEAKPAFIDEDEWEIITLSEGMDLALFKSSLENSPYDYISIYGYSEYTPMQSSFDSIKRSIENEEFDIAFLYNENYKDLPIYIDPKKISINDIAKTIKIICEDFGKTLDINL